MIATIVNNSSSIIVKITPSKDNKRSCRIIVLFYFYFYSNI